MLLFYSVNVQRIQRLQQLGPKLFAILDTPVASLSPATLARLNAMSVRHRSYADVCFSFLFSDEITLLYSLNSWRDCIVASD